MKMQMLDTTAPLSLQFARKAAAAGVLTLGLLERDLPALLLEAENEVRRELANQTTLPNRRPLRLSADEVKVAARGKLLGLASPGEQHALATLLHRAK